MLYQSTKQACWQSACITPQKGLKGFTQKNLKQDAEEHTRMQEEPPLVSPSCCCCDTTQNSLMGKEEE